MPHTTSAPYAPEPNDKASNTSEFDTDEAFVKAARRYRQENGIPATLEDRLQEMDAAHTRTERAAEAAKQQAEAAKRNPTTPKYSPEHLSKAAIRIGAVPKAPSSRLDPIIVTADEYEALRNPSLVESVLASGMLDDSRKANELGKKRPGLYRLAAIEKERWRK